MNYRTVQKRLSLKTKVTFFVFKPVYYKFYLKTIDRVVHNYRLGSLQEAGTDPFLCPDFPSFALKTFDDQLRSQQRPFAPWPGTVRGRMGNSAGVIN